MLSIFSYACWPPECLLWGNIYLDLLPFLIGLLGGVFLRLNFISCLYILEINPLSGTSFANISSSSVSCLLWFPFLCKACQFNLVLFIFISFTVGGGPKQYCYNFCRRMFCLYFPLGVSQYLVLHLGLSSSLCLFLYMVLENILFFFFFKGIYFLWLLWVFIVACGLFLVAASRGYSSLWSMGFLLWSSGSTCSGFSSCCVLCRLSSCGSEALEPWFSSGTQAWLLLGRWYFPRPEMEPVSPALTGKLSTTGPPRKSWFHTFTCSWPVFPAPFIERLSILFHWSVFLLLFQYHTVLLMTAALEHSLMSGSLMLLTPFFFSTLLWLLGSCVFSYKLKHFLVLWKMPLVIWQGLHWICRLPEAVQSFWQYPRTWFIFPSVCIIFNLFYQCLTVLECVFCLLS